jgi:hypothetical protein
MSLWSTILLPTIPPVTFPKLAFLIHAGERWSMRGRWWFGGGGFVACKLKISNS